MSLDIVNKYIGKIIENITIGETLIFITFSDSTHLQLRDRQECCEERYFVCDDNPQSLVGRKLKKIEVKEAIEREVEDSEEYHEVHFLEITTDSDYILIATHVEHNGYYGGIYIEALEYKLM